MNAIAINTPNGLQANKELNKLAAKLDKLYKNSKNVKRGFDIGFDGAWEYVIHLTKTDRAIVIKQDPKYNHCQAVFIYATSFSNQMSEDKFMHVANNNLLDFAQTTISLLSKNQ